MRRHFVLALLPVVLAVGGAVAFGLTRPPTYFAETRLWVGGFDLNQPGALTGYAAASSALAGAYSRAVSSAPVQRRTVARLRRREPDAIGSVSATPVAQSPVFKIMATGQSEAAAVATANAATGALRDYVATLNESSGDGGARLFSRFREASRELYQRRADTREAASLFRIDASEPNRRALISARSDEDAGRLRVETVREQYQAHERTASAGTAQIVVLNRASSATTDRRSFLQRLILAALAGGLVAGAALATLRANRRRRAR